MRLIPVLCWSECFRAIAETIQGPPNCYMFKVQQRTLACHCSFKSTIYDVIWAFCAPFLWTSAPSQYFGNQSVLTLFWKQFQGPPHSYIYLRPNDAPNHSKRVRYLRPKDAFKHPYEILHKHVRVLKYVKKALNRKSVRVLKIACFWFGCVCGWYTGLSS